MDPFVAFSLAQGIVGTRDEGAARRVDYNLWLVQRGTPISDEDLIDPQLFLEWYRSLPKPDRAAVAPSTVSARFTEVEGKLSRYAVRPVPAPDGVIWLDPAGFQIAQSLSMPGDPNVNASRRDYELVNDAIGVRIVRTY